MLTPSRLHCWFGQQRQGWTRKFVQSLDTMHQPLQGSEVVYSRHLQMRALRKLNILPHRVRIGLGLEEDPLAPNPFATHCTRTPRPGHFGAQPVTPLPPSAYRRASSRYCDSCGRGAERGWMWKVQRKNCWMKLRSVQLPPKSHFLTYSWWIQVVELDSSSGSESSNDSSSSSSDEANVKQPDSRTLFLLIVNY